MIMRFLSFNALEFVSGATNAVRFFEALGVEETLLLNAEDPELLQLHHDLSEGSGFSPEMIHHIMSNAVVVPRFDAYDQAMNMVESAIQESVNNQLGQSRMLIAQSDINIFLNK